MTISEEAVKAAMDAFHEAWNNNQGLDNELPVYAHRAALSAALPFLPVLEPSAARELALEEAARWHESEAEGYEAEIGGTDVTGLLLAKEHRISAIAIRALSSPDHADAGKVEGDGSRWRIFEAACSRGYWGIELEQASNDDEPILYPIKVHRDTLVRIVEAHNAGLPAAPSEGAE